MSAMLRGRHAWVFRALSRNPLVRRQDRIEALAVVLGLIVVILAIPVIVHLGRDHFARSVDRIEQQTRSLQKVEATVVEARSSAPNRYTTASRTVRAEWKAGFEDRVETVQGPAKVEVGDRIPVWLDEHGAVTRPPQTVADARGYAAAFGIGLWLGTAAACATAVMLTRMALDRRRFNAWDYEWKLISTPGGGWANSGKTD